MVVKNQIKFIKTLQQKKCRIKNGMFVVEGIKTVQELLNSDFKAHAIYSTDVQALKSRSKTIELVTALELKKMSGLQQPNTALGVFYIPEQKPLENTGWSIVLDDIRDPGNLGTIIRLCDWFGIRNLICSPNTVDCYNPKVLQATMGSITRINIVYRDLESYIKEVGLPVYGAFMNGGDMRKEEFPSSGILIMGNEANGISNRMETLLHKKVAIPQFGEKTTESLNVATATAILLSELHRI